MQDLIYELLYEVFPDECDIAGDANVRKIAIGHSEILRTRGGSNFDITQLVNLLIAAASLAKVILEMSSEHDKNKKPPLEKKDIPESDDISPQKREEIYQYILRQMKKDKTSSKDNAK